MKLGSPNVRKIFYPMKWPKDLPLQQVWVKLANPRLFVTVEVCTKKASFSQFYQILLQKWPPSATSLDKKLACTAGIQLYSSQ